MNIKSLLLTGALAVATLSIATAKSYDIVIGNPTTVANVALKPGEYRLKLEGSNAIFTDVDNGKQYSAPFKSGNAARKFDVTAVDAQKKADTDRIQSIELGGTSTILQFSDSE